MQNRFDRLAAAAVLICALAAGTTAAQEITRRPQNPPQQADRTQPALVSLDFKGGSLAQLIDAMRKSSSGAINVVMPADLATLQVDSVQLKDVSVLAALRAVLAGNMSMPAESPDGQTYVIAIDSIDPDTAAGSPVVYVSKRWVGQMMGSQAGRSSQQQSPQRQGVEVYSIQSLIRGGDAAAAKTVLTAIETALSLSQEQSTPPPEVKFHQDSGLILVRGTGSQVGLVGQVVQRMTNDQERLSAIQARQKLQAIDRQASIRKAEIKLQLAEAEMANQERLLEMVRKQNNPNDAAPGNMEQELQKLRATRDMALVEVERLHQEAAVSAQAGGDPGAQNDQVQGLIERIKQLEKELDQLKAKPAPKPNSREE